MNKIIDTMQATIATLQSQLNELRKKIDEPTILGKETIGGIVYLNPMALGDIEPCCNANENEAFYYVEENVDE